jgi:amino acid adenylation domain-containing protein
MYLEKKLSPKIILDNQQNSYKSNNVQIESAKYQCIHQLFEQQVLNNPNAIAVRFDEQFLTYSQLNQRANQLARYLQKLGVDNDSLVGISLERSLEMIVALLAVLKAGATYLPLDPSYPQERLFSILEDAQPTVLLTQKTQLKNLLQYPTHMVCLDADWQNISQNSDKNLDSFVTSENLAYVIYTSGSTGKPKGVLIPHSALINHSYAIIKIYNLQITDNVLQFASINFDVAAEEIYPTLLSGATIILRPHAVVPTITEFHELINQEQLTVLNLPASYWHEWVSVLDNLQINIPNSVHLVIVGNEKVLPERLMTWQKIAGRRVRWLNAYGLTETTITSTIYEPEIWVEKPDVNSVPVGIPINNTQVYLLDDNKKTVPKGMIGELYIGGAGLAKGYLNRPEMTAARFIPNPFSDNPNSLIYQTGDSARILPDGNIEVLGRVDSQVKIRGFRIQPEEIEAALNQHDCVAEIIVLAHEENPEHKYLVAYVILQQQKSVTARELSDFLKDKLPLYMIPSTFIFLDYFPLTANNKIDRRALPKPDKNSLNRECEYLAPRNQIETKLTEIWQKLFGISPIGIKDDFFLLGGNSLLAASLVTEIKQEFNKILSPAIAFEAPTIEMLARVCFQAENNTSSSIVKIQILGTKSPLFIIANDSFLYKHLVRYLDTEQPVYIIQEPLGNAQEMASRCLQKIRSIQPVGAYSLLGHSYEGLVAYEVAQQLVQANQDVIFLGLIDTPTPQVEMRMEKDFSLQTTYQRLKMLFGLSLEDKVSFIQERIQYRIDEAFKPIMPLLEEFSNAYVPQAYSGKLTLFAAEFEFYGLKNAYFGWDNLVDGGIDISHIPASHRSILLNPQKAKLIAQQLQYQLDNLNF